MKNALRRLGVAVVITLVGAIAGYVLGHFNFGAAATGTIFASAFSGGVLALVVGSVIAWAMPAPARNDRDDHES